jgi:ketosteroid isomerase-like protein
MEARPRAVTREALLALPASYFDAIEAMDLERVVSHFAEDATYIMQTSGRVLRDAREIRQMFADAFAAEKTVRHQIINLLVEESVRKIATEQTCAGEYVDGTPIAMHNCNLFDVGLDGRFTRVINWSSPRQLAACHGA